jgi:hypothetical protein
LRYWNPINVLGQGKSIGEKFNMRLAEGVKRLNAEFVLGAIRIYS